MNSIACDIVIIGAGPAGLAAACAARDAGARDVLIVERDSYCGGILNQCIHNGFGLHTFNEELTGPEYAARFEAEVRSRGIPCLFDTTVLSVNADRTVTAVNRGGVLLISAAAVILACGCRERPRGAINIAGTRPAGVYSAGTAQRLINIDGKHIGDEVFILGSGDIGLIMARRMTFEGARVKGVAELMPYSSGLNRNIAQCLNDFDIPLMLSTTVVEIRGRGRISSVVVAPVDADKNPVMDKAREIKCDTLLLSVGLLPENELAKGAGVSLCGTTGGGDVDDTFMTNVDGVFMCGNCLHVHDLVDYVSKESAAAGRAAAEYINRGGADGFVPVAVSGGVRYCVPQRITRQGEGALTLRMRVDGVYKKCALAVAAEGEDVYKKQRPIVTPGEMETLELEQGVSAKLRTARSVTVRLER